MDPVTKAEILSRLGLKTTPFITDTVGFNSITVFEIPPDFQLPRFEPDIEYN